MPFSSPSTIRLSTQFARILVWCSREQEKVRRLHLQPLPSEKNDDEIKIHDTFRRTLASPPTPTRRSIPLSGRKTTRISTIRSNITRPFVPVLRSLGSCSRSISRLRRLPHSDFYRIFQFRS